MCQNNSRWCYYNDEYNVFNDFDIKDPQKCRKLIELYFSLAGKYENVTDDLMDFLREHHSERFPHIVSVFFLLIYFCDNLEEETRNNLDARLKNITKDTEDPDKRLLFTLFLLAFCHDLGYKYEDSNNKMTDSNREYLKDKSSLIDELFRNDIVDIPKCYNPETIKSYLKYREYSDHGILGGIEILNRLINLKAEHKHNTDKYPLGIYQYVASIIIIHNIWFTNKTNKENYKKYIENRLHDLILEDNEYKLNLIDNTLPFLFILIDSIDPIKNNVNLENIEIAFDNDIIYIRTDNNGLIKKLVDLSTWLTPCKLSFKTSIEICNKRQMICNTI